MPRRTARTLAERWCDDDELAALDRLQNPSERHLRCVAHLLARRALALSTGLAEQALTLDRDVGGRPFAAGRALDFNLSHGGGWAAVACGTGGVRVGVDIEALPALGARAGTLPGELQGVFTAAESELIAATVPDRRGFAALRLWTLKEAVVKATGDGWRRQPRSFEVALDGARAVLPRAPQGYDHVAWSLRAWTPARDVTLALAVQGAAAPAVTLHRPGLPRCR